MRRISLEIIGSRRIDALERYTIEVHETLEQFRLFGDALERADFLIMRMWATPSRLKWLEERPDGVDDLVLAFVPVEGSGTLAAPGVSELLEPGLIALVPSSAFELVISTSMAIYILATHRRRLMTDGGGIETQVTFEISFPGSMQPFLSLTNAVIEASKEPDAPSVFSRFRLALEQVFIAGTAGAASTGGDRGVPGSSHDIFQQAVRLIDEHWTNPDFSVQKLAQMMHTSTNYLHRLFARRGDTPARCIRRLRIEEARRQLDMPADPSGEDLEAVARATGFSSARALRDALARSMSELSAAEDG